MISEKEYRRLKEEVDEAKAAAHRAKGALDQTLALLKKEFGVDNLKDAKKELSKLEEKVKSAQEAFEEAWQDYTEKWDEQDDERERED